MNYCNDCDIAYEEKNCPLCNVLEQIDRLKKEIQHLNNQE